MKWLGTILKLALACVIYFNSLHTDHMVLKQLTAMCWMFAAGIDFGRIISE